MRLWSIHPKYLDPIGLVALWREALLARKVLQGKTRGYCHHPQLDRFRSQRSPVAAMNAYLRAVWIEASRRGYSFDKGKLGTQRRVHPIPVTRGQLHFELSHLRRKLQQRSRRHLIRIGRPGTPTPHPLFRDIPGPIENWERR